MLKEILTSIRAILVLTVITSVAYPLVITVVAQLAFPHQANGSLVKKGDVVIGSELLAQKFSQPTYFAPRPSAADYATVPSGASNQGYTSRKLAAAISERRGQWGADAPADLLTASGSGLDPDISPNAAYWQADRIAKARGLAKENVNRVIESLIQKPQFGFLGETRVNVLALNLALDAASAGKATKNQ